MSEWWTYSLSDFLLFSPRTYYRLIELYNVAVWPWQIAGVAAGIAAVVSLRRETHADRVAPLVLAACWAWIAWAFHFERYAQINWAAQWFSLASAMQAMLLLGFAVPGTSIRPNRGRAALAAALLVIVCYPLLAPLSGRPWTTSEAFGTMPDPTALVTLVLALQMQGRSRWLLAAIPLAWCAIAAATLVALGSAQAYVIAAATLVALATGLRREPQPFA
jgi:hypothetical protein